MQPYYDVTEQAGRWTVEAIGDGEEYMPNNPDPVERAKMVRLLVWRVAGELSQ